MKQLPALSALLVLFTFSLPSQTKLVNGIMYPDNYTIDARRPASGLAKAASDTLHYKVFQKIKEDFVVNDDGGAYGADQNQISIAANPRDGFLCAWIDDRTGNKRIDAQLFDSSGNRKGAVIHISDYDATGNSEPHLAYNPKSNEYIVLWAGMGCDVLFQRLTADGEKIGRNATATQNQFWNTNNPSAAVDSSGNIIVTWFSDGACCSSEIPYCRIFDRLGKPISDQFPLVTNNAPITSMSWDDRIAADTLGHALIVWSSRVEGRSRILLQSVNRTGVLYEQPIIISDPADSTDHIFPTITSTKDGHFLIFWTSATNAYGRIYHPDSGFVSPQFALPYAAYLPCSISSDDQNTFFIIWPGGKWYGQRLSTRGMFIGAATPLTYTSDVVWWANPRLSKSISGRLYVAYAGPINRQYDVLVQAYDLSFNPIGASQKAADDGCSAWQYDPTVKFNQFGKSLIVWEDQRNGYLDVYGQTFDESYKPITSAFRISSLAVTNNSGTSITCDNDGNFIVGYTFGGKSSRKSLLMQKVSASGMLMGPWATVSDATYLETFEDLNNVIQTNDAGEVLASWYSNQDRIVYSRRFDAELNAAQAPLPVFTGNPFQRTIFNISSNRKFNILVMWSEPIYPQGNQLRAMIVNDRGSIVRDTVNIASIPYDRQYGWGDCRLDENNNLLFAWSRYDDAKSNWQIIVSRIYADGHQSRTDTLATDGFPGIQIISFEKNRAFVAWSVNGAVRSVIFDDNNSMYLPVNLQTPIMPYFASLGLLTIHHVFHADVHGDNLLVGYGSVQVPDRGADLFANVQRIDQVGYLPYDNSTEMTGSVYPNPTLVNATFQYQVFQPANVTIAVYNILGQRIAELDRGFKSPGNYTVRFPTKNMAAGVYFFVYNGVKTYSKKFIIMK